MLNKFTKFRNFGGFLELYMVIIVKLMNIIEIGVKITHFGIKISLVAQLAWTEPSLRFIWRLLYFKAYAINNHINLHGGSIFVLLEYMYVHWR